MKFVIGKVVMGCWIASMVWALMGCTLAPITLEEKMQESHVGRYDFGGNGHPSDYLQYHHLFLHADKHRNSIALGETIDPVAVDEVHKRNVVAPLIADLGLGASSTMLGAGLLLGFSNSMDVTTNVRRNISNSSAQQMAAPGVHFFNFDIGETVATPEDIDAGFERAMGLFNKTFNSDGACRMLLWTEELQYRRVHVKNVRGLYRDYHFSCERGGSSEKSAGVGVRVAAFANPVERVKVVGMMTMWCYLDNKDRFIDTRECGWPMANVFDGLLNDEEKQDWMRIVISQNTDDPSLLEVTTDYQGMRAVEPVNNTAEYKAFLGGLGKLEE